jgi:SpoVK/Ycf46/Vps4 family AAA+-type ATPase
MHDQQRQGLAHLREELARMVGRLGRQLERARRRGRTPAGEAAVGLVIEEGEAEGLVRELEDELAGEQQDMAREPVAGEPRGSPRSPLDQVREAFELLPHEYDVFVLALAVECDARLGRLVAFLNDHAAHTRPTVGLALAVAGRREPDAASALLARPLVRDGLLELEGDGPLPGRALRVAPELVARIAAAASDAGGATGSRIFPSDAEILGRLVLEEPVRARLVGWSDRLRTGARVPLVIGGDTGSGRTTAAAAATGRAGVPLLAVDLPMDAMAPSLLHGRRDARWRGAALCLRLDPPLPPPPPSAWRALWAGLAGFPHPVVLAVPASDAEAAAAAAPEEPATVELQTPRAGLRALLWGHLLPGGSDEAAAVLAPRFQFGPGRIARAIRRAERERQIEGRPSPPSVDELARAARAMAAAAMSNLAQKLPLPHARDALVVPARIAAELDLAVAWIRHRVTVLERWGFGQRMTLGRGLTALFTGPPGTGKTMAAQVMARDLDLDLYRVDLARVVSKYIGETEKNLGRLFDEAHASGAILFFDEADALFGKRSEVHDAHDRYANVEIGYLLQRMEEHEGVAILATNRFGDMDPAFVRRFSFILDFPMPDREQRLRIWCGMLLPPVEREPDLDLAPLAELIAVSGGEIRNAVLAAAYLAASEGRPIAMAHLKAALRRELHKNGRVLDQRAQRALDSA